MKTVNNKLYLVALTLFFSLFIACGNVDVEEENDEMPLSVSFTVNEYFPGYGVSRSVKLENGDFEITIKGGPTFVLKPVNENPYGPYASLVSYTGNGDTMPVNMAQDKLPEKVVNYLSGLEMLDQIFDMYRKGDMMYVEAGDPETVLIEYNVKTEVLTQS